MKNYEVKIENRKNTIWSIYVLIKNGTHLGKTTTDEQLWNNSDLARIMQ